MKRTTVAAILVAATLLMASGCKADPSPSQPQVPAVTAYPGG